MAIASAIARPVALLQRVVLWPFHVSAALASGPLRVFLLPWLVPWQMSIRFLMALTQLWCQVRRRGTQDALTASAAALVSAPAPRLVCQAASAVSGHHCKTIACAGLADSDCPEWPAHRHRRSSKGERSELTTPAQFTIRTTHAGQLLAALIQVSQQGSQRPQQGGARQQRERSSL